MPHFRTPRTHREARGQSVAPVGGWTRLDGLILAALAVCLAVAFLP